MMKIRALVIMLAVFGLMNSYAQKGVSVLDYYNAGIDSLVAKFGFVEECDEEEKTNPVYARIFLPPVLYGSILSEAFRMGAGEECSNEIGTMDSKRKAVIDKLLLNVYRTSPESVSMTESDLRNAKPISNETKISTLELGVTSVKMPTEVAGGMKTTVVKPSYWKSGGRVEFRFSQNYVSGNWFQGGESNKTMLGLVDFDLNYDDKNRITMTNHVDIDLGFATSKADTLHSYRTNTDRLKLESSLGYKLVRNLDLAARIRLETQMLANYPVNSNDFVSKFLAPFEANFSVGFNYKPRWKNFGMNIYLAPLSAYNYKFVRYGYLATRYGINSSRHHKEDFGTQLIVEVPNMKLFDLVNFWTKAEYYTNYERVFFHLEAKFDIALTRYFTASLNMHARFDDSAPGLYDDEYGYWQFKELMTLGLVYSW